MTGSLDKTIALWRLEVIRLDQCVNAPISLTGSVSD